MRKIFIFCFAIIFCCTIIGMCQLGAPRHDNLWLLPIAIVSFVGFVISVVCDYDD